MYTKNIELENIRGDHYALSCQFDDVPILMMDIIEAKDAGEATKAINAHAISKRGWRLLRNGNLFTSWRTIDAMGNFYYLIVWKETTK